MRSPRRTPRKSTKPTPPRAGATTYGIVTAVIIAAGALGWWVLGKGIESTGSGVEATEVSRVEERHFEIITVANGELVAKNQIEIRSKVESQTTILEIVPEGTYVKAGDMLVLLNADAIEDSLVEEELRYQDALSQYEAAETAYQIQISDNESNLRKAGLSVELKTLALKQWENGDHEKRVQELDLAIEKADRELERLRDKVAKSQDLFDNKFLSKNELEVDKLQLVEAEANVQKTTLEKRIYDEYQVFKDQRTKESELTDAEGELQKVMKQNEINLASKDSARINRKRQLEQRADKLAELREQLEFCTINAPSGGLVVYGTTTQADNWRNQSEGPLSVGRQVRSNDLLIVLPDTSEMVAKVRVHESLAGRIQAGQRATISIEAAGVNTGGTVEQIGVMAEGGGWRDPNRREYTVRVALDEASPELKPSMRCETRIIMGEVDADLAVPVQAIFNEGPVRFAYVPRENRYARVPVAVGRSSDTFAQITAGLVTGDFVLLREPKPGEVLSTEWDTAELEAAGYQIAEDGTPQPKRAARPARTGRPGSVPGVAGRPGRPAGTGGSGRPGARPTGRPGSTPTAPAKKTTGEGKTNADATSEPDADAAKPEATEAEATGAKPAKPGEQPGG